MTPYAIKAADVLNALNNRTYDVNTRASYKFITNRGVGCNINYKY